MITTYFAYTAAQSIRCPVTADGRHRLLGMFRSPARLRRDLPSALHSTGLTPPPARFGLPMQSTVSVNVFRCMYHNIAHRARLVKSLSYNLGILVKKPSISFPSPSNCITPFSFVRLQAIPMTFKIQIPTLSFFCVSTSIIRLVIGLSLFGRQRICISREALDSSNSIFR